MQHLQIKKRFEKDELIHEVFLQNGKYSINPEPVTFYWGNRSLKVVETLDKDLKSASKYSPKIAHQARSIFAHCLHDAVWVQKHQNMISVLDDLHKIVKSETEKGNKVVLLGYSAGSFVTYQYYMNKSTSIDLSKIALGKYGNQFDEIIKIILNQNDAHYDGRYVSPDVKELMNEYYKVKYSNTRSPSLEEKKAFITSKTGIDINTINKMTYRYFDLVYSSSVNNDLYFAQKMVQCSYKYDVKEDVRHPLFEPPKDPYAEIFEDTGILSEKGISGADKLNAQNAKMMLEDT